MRLTAVNETSDPLVEAGLPPLSEPTSRYRVLRGVGRCILRVAADVDVEGAERLPEEGPYILAINHLALLDTFVAFAVGPHQYAGIVAKRWADRRIVGAVMRSTTTIFPVDSDRTDPRMLARAVRWLRDGGVLLLAPEGHISPTGALERGMPGLAYIAGRTGAPVVPFVAWGQERVGKDLRKLRRPRIHVRIGEPFLLPRLHGRDKSEQLDAQTDTIMLRLAALLPAEYRGVYGHGDPTIT